MLNNLPSLFEYRDWESGESGTLTLTACAQHRRALRPHHGPQGASAGTFGQGLLLVLFIIGGLFLVIEFVALVAGLALAKSITGSVHQLFTGTERVRQGDFTHKIAVQTDDQLGELAGVVQLDDREHRGSAAAGGGEEAARGRAAHRA